MVSFILALLIGGGAIMFGVINKKRHNALKEACTAQTLGMVVRTDIKIETETYEDEEEEEEDRRIKTREVLWYYPVFEFSADGRKIIKTGTKGTGSPKFHDGEQVNVLYNPNNPDEFYVKEDTSGDMLELIPIVAGAGIILTGLLLLFI